ncbi:cold-shock protein [Bradyrhizobium sp. USDA 336]|uniref:cold-shock protein n=1 Tax=Bradyrhizobium sp. USDA 336 TaxID=3156311 RepID=UPI0038367096
MSWFKLDKKFGFAELVGGMGDAFLHVSVLKAAGYVTVPAGTTIRARLEIQADRRRLVEVISIDTSTVVRASPRQSRAKMRNDAQNVVTPPCNAFRASSSASPQSLKVDEVLKPSFAAVNPFEPFLKSSGTGAKHNLVYEGSTLGSSQPGPWLLSVMRTP